MGNEIREAMFVAIDVLVFSLLLLIIFFFGRYANNAFVLKKTQDLTITDIQEYRNVYQFSMGKEITKEELKNIAGDYPYLGLSQNKAKELSNIVTGDDIVRLVGLYPKEYKIYISNDSKHLELTSDSDVSEWSMSTVSDWLGEDVTKEFYCLFVYDEVQYKYDSVIFIRVK